MRAALECAVSLNWMTTSPGPLRACLSSSYGVTGEEFGQMHALACYYHSLNTDQLESLIYLRQQVRELHAHPLTNRCLHTVLLLSRRLVIIF